MKTNEKISVILPTFNERDGIIPLIEAIHEELGEYNHEVIVVDDNSPDGTYEAVKNYKAPYLKTVLRTSDPSLAKSIRCGLEHAVGDVLVVMDSDFNHQPKYIPFMIRSLSDFDCVTASRYMYGGGMKNPFRHVCSWIFNIFTDILTGGLITDPLYGFFAIKRRVLEECPYDLVFWGYGDYCIRLMYFLQKKNVSILQFPAVHGRRFAGEGNDNLVKTFCQYSFEVMRLSFKRITDKRY